MLVKMLDFTEQGVPDAAFFPQVAPLREPLGSFTTPLPQRRTDVDLSEYSRVMGKAPVCGSDTPPHLHPSPPHATTNVPEIVPSTLDVLSPELAEGRGGGEKESNNAAPGDIADITSGGGNNDNNNVPNVNPVTAALKNAATNWGGTISAGPIGGNAGGEGGGGSRPVPQVAVPDQQEVQVASTAALEENAMLQSAAVSAVIHQTSRVDPAHLSDDQDERNLRFGAMDARMKLSLVLTGGLCLGLLTAATHTMMRRRKRETRKGGQPSRRIPGRTSALLNK
jgi:hypothetical protein